MRVTQMAVVLLAVVALPFGNAGGDVVKPDASAGGLVLLVSHRDAESPCETIRVTIENRSKKPLKAVAPPDIYPSWSANDWWYCRAYRLCLCDPDGNAYEFSSSTPQPPAMVPQPRPLIMDLLPGQSVGALLFIGDLPEPSPDIGPPSPNSSWRRLDKTKDSTRSKGKYILTAEYDPSYFTRNGGPKLAPYAGHKLTSNVLEFTIENEMTTHNKAIDSD